MRKSLFYVTVVLVNKKYPNGSQEENKEGRGLARGGGEGRRGER